MAKNLRKRHDLLGTVLVDDRGEPEKILTRCPHCGLIDYRHSSQGAKNTHWQSWNVGGVREYQCGKCRKSFFTLEVQVPLDMEPMAMYKKINSVFAREVLSEASKVPGSDEGFRATATG